MVKIFILPLVLLAVVNMYAALFFNGFNSLEVVACAILVGSLVVSSGGET